jgi:hypothetical protein
VGQPILAAAGFQPASRYATYVGFTIALLAASLCALESEPRA